MPEIKLSRIATIGIALSLAYTLTGIILHEPPALFHPSLAGLGGLLLFPTSMYIVFTGSLKSGKPRTGPEAIPPIAAVALASITPPLVLYTDPRSASIVAALSLAALLAHTVYQVKGWRRPEPRVLLFYPPLSGLASYTLAAASPHTSSITLPAIAGLAYAAPMIFLVSLYTIARNYGTQPTSPLVYTPFVAHAATLPHAYTGNLEAMTITTSIAGIAYMTIMGIPHKIPRLLDKARKLRQPAKSSLHYTLASHLVAYTTLILAAWTAFNGNTLTGIHYITLGFTGAQILLHAPLMLPQVTGIILNKDYKPIPPLLVLIAAITRDQAPQLSTITTLLAFIISVIQFRPKAIIKRVAVSWKANKTKRL